MKTLIHVNQHNIKANDEVLVHGPSRIVYAPDNPLACGARVWIETQAEVEVLR